MSETKIRNKDNSLVCTVPFQVYRFLKKGSTFFYFWPNLESTCCTIKNMHTWHFFLCYMQPLHIKRRTATKMILFWEADSLSNVQHPEGDTVSKNSPFPGKVCAAKQSTPPRLLELTLEEFSYNEQEEQRQKQTKKSHTKHLKHQ